MDVQRRGAAIEIVGLRKEYGRDAGAVVALADIDLTSRPASSCASWGRAAAASRRLLRILAGLDRQSGGTIKVGGAGLGGRERHGVPGERPVPLDERRDQCGLRPDDPRRARRGGGRPRRGRAQARRPHQVPPALSASALRRHAAAQRHRARLRDRSRHAADGRAVRGARCPEPGDPAGRAGAAVGGDPQDRDLCHPLDRGGAVARRPHRGDDRAARPHQADHRRAVSASAQPDDALGLAGIRPAQARHLAGAGGRGERAPARRWRNETETHVRQIDRAAALPRLADRAARGLAAAADGGLRRPPLHSGAERHRGAFRADGRQRRARVAHRRHAVADRGRLCDRRHPGGRDRAC